MYCTPQIHLNHLSYCILHTPIQFLEIQLSFVQKRYGIVGDNGIGKTTLLKLIAGILTPHQGSIRLNGSLSFCPQDPIFENQTVAEVLGIAPKLEAYCRITAGHCQLADYELLENDWNFEARMKSALEEFSLENIELNRFFSSLSGGQQTQCL